MRVIIRKKVNYCDQLAMDFVKHWYYRLTSKYGKWNYKQIPIVINNFNRLSCLKRLIKSLKIRGYSNIIILDNDSSYPPLLDWYKNECKERVVFLDKNLGHKALWSCDLIKEIGGDYFVYTDPDLELIEDCPEDFLYQMLCKLKKKVKGQKVGLSLKIDDIPDCYKFRDDVIKNESRFYESMEDGMYLADLDTTFAIHEPYAEGGFVDDMITYRMPYPIQCRHLPWYEDSDKPSEEDLYYASQKLKDIGWWSSRIELLSDKDNNSL
jgi:hypothetical protein